MYAAATKDLRAAVLSPLSVLMLVAGQRRELAKQFPKVTTQKLFAWLKDIRWSQESELKEVSLNLLDRLA